MNLIPKKKVTLSALAASLLLACAIGSASAAEIKVKDVDSKNSYYEDVQFVLQNDIMSLDKNLKFTPNKRVSKELAAQYVGKAIQIDVNEPVKQVKFTDVSTSNANYPYISTLTDLGAFTSSSKFNGSADITRQELARLIVEAYDFKVVKTKTFTDTKNSSYKDYVSTAVEMGLMKPQKEKIFNPTGTVTHAEFARIIHLAELKEEELTKPENGSKPTINSGNNGSVPATAIPYINAEGVRFNGDTLQYYEQMPVTIQKEEVIEPIPGVTAAVIEKMREENRKNGQSAKIVHDPSLDKLAYQRVKQWGQIWEQYGSSAAAESSKAHFSNYVPLPHVQVIFHDNKYNFAEEIITIAVDWISYGATPQQFGETIIENFNTSDNHSIFYRNQNAEFEEEFQTAYGVAYEKNPRGSYNVVIVKGSVSPIPTSPQKHF
ncbi:s-layer domain-containing protein [Lysinibacillus fusiformis ZB2]|nr:s-layer domain-containing protein [Lysinibacillus fusiformis ZB2]